MLLEALGQHHFGHLYPVEAVSLVACLAIEVRVEVLVVLLTMAVAEFVFRAVVAALDGVNQVLFSEEGQCPEHVRLVDGLYSALQFLQRLWLYGTGQCLDHHDAVGSGFDVVLFEQFYACCFVHPVYDFEVFGDKGTKKNEK